MIIFFENVKKLCKEKGLTIETVVNKAGLTIDSYNSYKRHENLPRADEATKIANELDTTVEYLVTGKNAPQKKDAFSIPFLSQKLSAGRGTEIVSAEQPESWIQVSDRLRPYKDHLAAFLVKGDSMEPTIHDGDIVVCDNLGYDNSEGIYVVYLNGTGLIKRIQIGVGKIYVKSDNPKYSAIEEPLESQAIQIVGKVRAHLSIF